MDDKLNLSTPIDELQQRILNETDGDQLQKVVDLFNLNIKKKDVLRNGKLSQLQDKISEQIGERIENHADEFSNKDLLDYFKVIQDTIGKSDNLITQENIPAIQFNQQNVNIQVAGTELSRESKDKVINKVRELLSKYEKESNEVVDTEFHDIVEDTL